jgi:RHS repeat-associated protein
VTTEYVLDPIGLAQVLVETTGGQSRHYVPGLAQYDGSGWEYYVSDRLGSVRLLVAPNGDVSLGQNFDPFGNVLEQSGPGQSVFGYTGEQMDLTGLVFLRARYYDPSVGRFLTPDTIVPDPLRSMGWNRYAYVENNPIVYTDPSGRVIRPGFWFCLFGKDPETGECKGSPFLPPGFGGATMTATDPYGGMAQLAIFGIAVAVHITLELMPPFELPGFNEGVEPETGNICYPEPNISNPLADQPLENFPIPGTTGPNVHVDAPERPEMPNIFEAWIQHTGRFPPVSNPGDVLYRLGDDGKINSYQVYGTDGLPIKRVDIRGRSHGGIPTPHVQEYVRHVAPDGTIYINRGSVRPANPGEVITDPP